MEVPAYVTFHFINAYEEDKNGDGKATVIIADCCEHNADTRILDMLRLDTLRSSHVSRLMKVFKISFYTNSKCREAVVVEHMPYPFHLN